MLMPFGFSNSSVNTGIGRQAIGNEKGHHRRCPFLCSHADYSAAFALARRLGSFSLIRADLPERSRR